MNPILRNFLIGGAIVLIAITALARTSAQKKADAELGFVGIPGPIDEIAAATNRISGGLLARFGSFLGETISGVTDTRTLEELTGTESIPTGFVGPPRIG